MYPDHIADALTCCDAVVHNVEHATTGCSDSRSKPLRDQRAICPRPTHGHFVTLEIVAACVRAGLCGRCAETRSILRQHCFAETTRAAMNQNDQFVAAEVQLFEC